MHDIPVILTITLGLSAALVFGYITHRLGLSPIVGYLLAGVAVGPHTPGYVADLHIANQLAEIGVILLMFGVGLHFHLKDLLAVKSIAVPAAIIQCVLGTILGVVVARGLGWEYGAGIVFGIAISVTSTVVLTRVLMDNDALNTSDGHISIGWLVVEDILTVLVLVLLPAFADPTNGTGSEAAQGGIWFTLVVSVGKLSVLTVLMLWGGPKLIPWLMAGIARTRSRELFTLGVLVIALGIAALSTVLFGASMALGAFLAGMVVGQSDMSHQAASDALPMRDAFAVLFFVSVGMLFDPHVLFSSPGALVAVLAIILIGKPLISLGIMLAYRYPIRAGLNVGMARGQIGEFSFILADLALNLKILPEKGQSLLVAAALLSITVNPLVYKSVVPFEKWLQSKPAMLRVLNWRAQANGKRDEGHGEAESAPVDRAQLKAVVVGYGPVGKTLTRILQDFDIHPTIIDMNIDTVKKLTDSGFSALYGDASRQDILDAAGIKKASYLMVTLPDLAARFPVVAAAKMLNPEVKIFVRARYLGERAMLEESGASAVAYEESEVAVAIANFLLTEVGASAEEVEKEGKRIRNEISMRTGFTMVMARPKITPPATPIPPSPPPEFKDS